jgi:hypothetical protein
VAGLSPGVAGLSPGVADEPPGVASLSPGVAGFSPEVAGFSPEVAGFRPGAADEPPGVAGKLSRTHTDPHGQARTTRRRSERFCCPWLSVLVRGGPCYRPLRSRAHRAP